MKKKRRPARPPSPAKRAGVERSATLPESVAPVASSSRIEETAPKVTRRPLAVAVVLVGLFGAIAAGGILAMTLASRWISPGDLLPWNVAGLSFAITGVAGVCFALLRQDAGTFVYVRRTICATLPIAVALAMVNAAIAVNRRQAPVIAADAQLREQVERLSAERKDLMKALFAAGKFETQATTSKARLQERELALAASDQERNTLRGELEKLKGQFASAQSSTTAQNDAALAQLRGELEARAQRLALLEAAQQDTRRELESIQQDLRRGRRVTEARVGKIVAKLPADAPIAAE